MALAKITYTNKETLNEQPSIAAKNKVTSDDMNQIKSVVNENDDNIGTLTNLKTTAKSNVVGAINELVDTQAYSTTEVKTNKVWTDGKPIYRKVLKTGPITVNYEKSINTGLTTTSISEFTNIYGFCTFSNGFIPINFYNPSMSSYSIFTYINTQQTNVRIIIKSGVALDDGYITIEYTKASD